MIQHNDFDSSGTHLSDYKHLDQSNWDDDYKVNIFSDIQEVDEAIFSKLKNYIKIHNSLTFSKIFGKIIMKIKKKVGIKL
jgi:hypothetical protein